MVGWKSKVGGDQLFEELYGPGGVARPGNGDDDDGGDEEDSEATPSYQPRKRRHH